MFWAKNNVNKYNHISSIASISYFARDFAESPNYSEESKETKEKTLERKPIISTEKREQLEKVNQYQLEKMNQYQLGK